VIVVVADSFAELLCCVDSEEARGSSPGLKSIFLTKFGVEILRFISKI